MNEEWEKKKADNVGSALGNFLEDNPDDEEDDDGGVS